MKKNLDLISTKEAAKILGVSASRMRQMVAEKRLSVTRIGRDNLINPKDLEPLKSRQQWGINKKKEK